VNLSALCINRPFATALLMVGLLLCGLVCYPLLPVSPLPDVNYPTISVTAELPGADPQTMAPSVATPLEEQFGQIPDIVQMTSSSTLGYSTITLQFGLKRNIDGAASDVLAAINAAGGQLPPNMTFPPTIRKVNPADTPILVLAVTSDTVPLTTVDAYAENILLEKIAQVPGVGLVGIGGQQKPAIRIQVDPLALAARGLGLETVRSVIGNANVDLPKGTLNSPRVSYTLNTNDQLLEPDQYDNLIIAYQHGSPVRVRDIGRAVSGPENNLLAGWENEKRAIILAIQRQPGANVVATVDAVKAALPRLQASIPPTIKVSILSDRTQTIRASIADVQSTLLLSVALVVMVIFLFLRNLWATIIPAITIPLALIGTFAVLYVLGYSLDNLSLMALTIAVGFVVDDAVVVIENVVRHLEEGLSPMQATLKGAGEIGFTIISITLSLIAVFIPLFLMPGYVGLLFREFAITIGAALVLSLLISLTLTPVMCSRLLRPEAKQHSRPYLLFEAGFNRLLGLYSRSVRRALKHRFITLMVMFGTIAVTGYLYVVIPKGFFPQQDTGMIIAIAEAAQDVSFTGMSERMEAVVRVILKDPAVASVGSQIGATGGSTLNDGRMFIALKPETERTASADEIIARLGPELARLEGVKVYMQAAQDITIGARVSRTQYQYTLVDADAGELSHWAPIFQEKLKTIPGMTDVASDQADQGRLIDITVNRDAASSYGILPATVDNTLDDAFGQRIVSTMFEPLNQYHVILEVEQAFQTGPDALKDLYVGTPTGQQVPITALVDVNSMATPIAINHQGQFPSVTLSFNLKPGTSIGEAVDAIRAVEQQLGKPASLTTSFQGNAQAFESSLSKEPILIAAALVVIYIILGVLYESAVHPITILSTLPSAGIGALLMLMAFHFDLSVIALIGIILLIGIVKKNGIMLVDFALDAERNHGMAPEDAIYQACLLRFRPILMTTTAALLGGVPLMLGTGTGSELRQPLGYTIVGGLMLSQLLTLYTTPVVYLYLDRLSARWMAGSSQAMTKREGVRA
jgi:hydrophobe/amphiphile efflux-1 (HAE1) family protein